MTALRSVRTSRPARNNDSGSIANILATSLSRDQTVRAALRWM